MQARVSIENSYDNIYDFRKMNANSDITLPPVADILNLKRQSVAYQLSNCVLVIFSRF